MADNKVESCRYVAPYDFSLGHGYVESFAKSARTAVTAYDAWYPVVPSGYYAAFAGYRSSSAYLCVALFNPNATNDETLVSIRNTHTSAVNNNNCTFHCTYIRSDMIDDQRDI